MCSYLQVSVDRDLFVFSLCQVFGIRAILASDALGCVSHFSRWGMLPVLLLNIFKHSSVRLWAYSHFLR